ncbi:unnamed protein product [Staurois parvus]|uniref:Uncharacterized protein n=1 Tax=Staurois parvus TaxID=386267 RepID=A0ABN9GG12_9NEOB|nr:unnamed protein product [Staurois parvus]
MSLLQCQCPRQCNPADAGICLLGSVPWERRDVRGTRSGGKFENDKNKTLLYQTISHTFCPECFVLCPACISAVPIAWKLINVHGVQKASL